MFNLTTGIDKVGQLNDDVINISRRLVSVSRDLATLKLMVAISCGVIAFGILNAMWARIWSI